MNLATHYQSYREQVQADALPGYVEYAAQTPTADPQNYPTVLDFLKTCTAQLKSAVDRNDAETYFRWLSGHQEAALALFKRMFDEQLDKEKDSRLATLDLVHRYGWRALKFSDVVIEFDNLTIIPRYSANMRQYLDKDLPCLNADEVHAVMSIEPDPEVVQHILSEKRRTKGYIVSATKTEFTMVDFTTRNQEVVRDWTGRLH